MEISGFRIIEVSIEGFKGFTKKQSLPLDGKHLFLLGPNGYGKSSILEAIRWGLFGSTKRQGEIVLNQNYIGACRVELALTQGGKNYRLRRTLIRGVTGGTDAVLFDDLGKEQNLKEVMPQLDSAAAGEGLHLVYTAQAAKQKRSVEDLKPFERTLYSYLGLTDVRLAIDRLNKFVWEQDAVLESVGKKLAEVEQALSKEVAAVEDARDTILANPPWGNEITPTVEQTKQKLLAFSREVALLISVAEPNEAGDTEELCKIVGSYVTKASSLGKVSPTKELAQVESKILNLREAVKRWRAASSSLVEARSALNVTQEDLRKVLGGKTEAEVEIELASANKQLDDEAETQHFKHITAIILSKSNAEGKPVDCPVCRLPIKKEEVIRIINEDGGPASKIVTESTLNRNRLRTIMEQVQALKSTLSIREGSYRSCELEVDKQKKGLISGLGTAPGIEIELETEVEKHIEVLEHQTEVLKGQIENAKDADRQRQSKLGRLQDEVKLHSLQRKHLELQVRQEANIKAKENLRSLMNLRETTLKISMAMERGLLAELKTSLAPVDKAMSEAFVALTHHPAYDRVFVDPDLLPKLELKVGSTTEPTGKWDDSVLNGQATSALALVPYFAFSQLTDMPFEVHVMLVDDPTQSFDKKHIETLVEKLSQVGQKIQLVLSSHELELFEEFIPKYFTDAPYNIIELTKFSIKEGPIL